MWKVQVHGSQNISQMTKKSTLQEEKHTPYNGSGLGLLGQHKRVAL